MTREVYTLRAQKTGLIRERVSLIFGQLLITNATRF